MVEAPGYCPPGPKCLFHPIIYRRSRLPGTTKIGNLCSILKESAIRMSVGKRTKGTGNRPCNPVMAIAQERFFEVPSS